MPAELADAIIIQADHFRFRAGERRRSPAVQSRRMFWCRSGRGAVVVDGERFAIAAGTFLLMPWGHDVAYEAGPRSACEVGSIHLIPAHDRGVAPAFGDIPHEPGAWPVPGRSDRAIPGLEGARHRRTLAGHLDACRPLALLAEYVVCAFRVPDETGMRALARMLVRELATALTARPEARSPACRAAIARLGRPGPAPSLGELAGLMGLSPTGALRSFRRETGLTPRRWLMAHRIGRARELLLTTDRPVHEIGAEVGMAQPHYFSRLFRQITGLSPRQCRAGSRFV